MPPRGWYEDGQGSVRWWDGTQWTENVAPSTSGAEAFSAPSPGYAHSAPTAYGYGPAQPTSSDSPSPSGVGPYAGADAPGSALAAQASPQKSKAWIAWLIVGIVLIGIVAAVAVLAVRLIAGGIAGPSAGSDADPGSSARPSPQPEVTASVEPDEADPDAAAPVLPGEAAAVAAIEAHNQAWLESDCDAYFATTTENYRTLMELTDCESFYSDSRNFAAQVSDFQMTVREVEQIGNALAVSVTESFMSPYDDEGNETAEPQLYESRWEYLVVDEGGVSKVDDWFED